MSKSRKSLVVDGHLHQRVKTLAAQTGVSVEDTTALLLSASLDKAENGKLKTKPARFVAAK